MWLVHNLNLLNLDRLTKLPQIQTHSIRPFESFFFWMCLKRVPPSYLPCDMTFLCVAEIIYHTLAVMSSGFSGHVSFYLHKAHSAVKLNLLFTFV